MLQVHLPEGWSYLPRPPDRPSGEALDGEMSTLAEAVMSFCDHHMILV